MLFHLVFIFERHFSFLTFNSTFYMLPTYLSYLFASSLPRARRFFPRDILREFEASVNNDNVN